MSVTETPNDIAAIADNLRRVRERIANAAIKAGRKPEDVTLVAVSKTKPIEAVRAALAAGQTVFGENRVQEAATKFPRCAPSIGSSCTSSAGCRPTRRATRCGWPT